MGERGPPYLDEFVSVAAGGAPLAFDAYFAPMDRHFHICAFSLQPGAFATVFEDITERKRSEEERCRLEAEFQHMQQLDSLGSLAGGVAHDMNNVLQAIQGMTSVLKVKCAEDPGLASGLDLILSACTRGGDLVKNLTDFARKGLQQPSFLDPEPGRAERGGDAPAHHAPADRAPDGAGCDPTSGPRRFLLHRERPHEPLHQRHRCHARARGAALQDPKAWGWLRRAFRGGLGAGHRAGSPGACHRTLLHPPSPRGRAPDSASPVCTER